MPPQDTSCRDAACADTMYAMHDVLFTLTPVYAYRCCQASHWLMVLVVYGIDIYATPYRFVFEMFSLRDTSQRAPALDGIEPPRHDEHALLEMKRRRAEIFSWCWRLCRHATCRDDGGRCAKRCRRYCLLRWPPTRVIAAHCRDGYDAGCHADAYERVVFCQMKRERVYR